MTGILLFKSETSRTLDEKKFTSTTLPIKLFPSKTAKPFLILALLYLKDLEKSENILLSSMTNTLYFSRVAGALFVISFLIGF